MVLGDHRQLQACQVNEEREKIISQIEETARVLEESGACGEWFGKVDPKIAKVHMHLLASCLLLLATFAVTGQRDSQRTPSGDTGQGCACCRT